MTEIFDHRFFNELGVTVYTPTQVLNQSHVVIMFQSGAGVEVVENERRLTARVYLPITYMVSSGYYLIFENLVFFAAILR